MDKWSLEREPKDVLTYASKISVSGIGRSIVRGFKGGEDYCNREKTFIFESPGTSREGNTTIEHDFIRGRLHYFAVSRYLN